ncbi:fimbrial biogenesis chaperone [Thiomicrospira microaerophila]|uniref:fimbrial biogenesis chaperone n=1 Tax=Thiomicrospira microaerophila TaxID=406020 RepID=UPI0005C7F9F8|nr:fimbria/pilus periplasmic chaperone [Thiomicrospira microaerophila]
MGKYWFAFKGLLVGFLLMFSMLAHANLLITPVRVVFDTRDRASHVNIVNTTSQVQSFRIELVDLLQNEAGGYQRLSDADDTSTRISSAKDLIRYSPRQVTLNPGESQRIRLSVRRPSNLSDGEYRSHLSFTALPEPQRIEQTEGAQTGIHVLLSITIPVVVRQGNPEVEATINRVELIQDKQNGDDVRVNIKRQGTFGVFGTVSIEWRPNARSEYQKIGEVNSFAVYRELDERINSRIPLNEGHKLQAGWYRVTFKGDEFFNHRVFDSHEFQWQP